MHFPNAGRHEITARLESDAVAADNYRYCVDRSAAGRAGVAGRRRRGGPRRPLSELGAGARRGGADRHSAADRNAPLLEPQAAGRLSGRQPGEHRAAGRLGGRGLGEVRRRAAAAWCSFSASVRRRSISTTFCIATGRGFSPCRWPARPSWRSIASSRPPTFRSSRHFIFRVFAGKRNTFLQTVAVERYFAVPEGWRPPPDSTVRVAARLRNGAPLVVERSFGKGRVMAFLTTAAPAWNNWARNPSFVVVVQDLQAYLSQRPGDEEQSRLVGSPLELRLDPAVYQPQVRFTYAGDGRRGDHGRQRAVVTADGTLGGLAARHGSERILRSPAHPHRRGRRDPPLCAERRSGRRRPERAGTPNNSPPGWKASSTSTSRRRPSSPPRASWPATISARPFSMGWSCCWWPSRFSPGRPATIRPHRQRPGARRRRMTHSTPCRCWPTA